MVINLELHGIAEAPGAMDEVDALFAAQGTLRHGAHFQHAVWIAGACGWGAVGASVVGSRAASVGVVSRVASSVAVGRMVVRDPSWFGLLVLYPVRDLMGFFFWASSYLGSKILWRGRVFQLMPGGKMRAAENRREEWQGILDREVKRWSLLSCDEALAELGAHDIYEVVGDSKQYQVEVVLLENTPEYLHISIAVDDGSLPASIHPAIRSFMCRKAKTSSEGDRNQKSGFFGNHP